MIVVLNFCQKDATLALKSLQWLGELGGAKKHDLILQCNVTAAAAGLTDALNQAALDIFNTVVVRVQDMQDERGWPWSPNAAWLDAVMYVRDKVQKPWLWLEPDAVFLKPGSLDAIEAAYLSIPQGKHFMGAEVRYPQHRMSGVAVYPPWVAQFTRGLPALSGPKAGPWDQVLARDFNPYVHFTPLIQNIWNITPGDPKTAPTFPDAESLKLISPEAVLFHRDKTGTLIDRLRERNNAGLNGIMAHPDVWIPPHDNNPVLPTTISEDDEIARLKRENAELIARLTAKAEAEAPLGKPARTPERIAADKARMAKCRAGRKKMTGVV